MVTRRFFFGIAVMPLFAPRAQSHKFEAIAAAHMPHTLSIRSSDPQLAADFSRGGIFELREYPSHTDFLHFDSLEARDRAWTRWNVERTMQNASAPCPSPREAPRRISLYRPISA